MLKQCESWKRFTSTQINRLLRRTGRFWQADAFDHLVRSEAQFDYLRSYIAENPRRANLKPNEYFHYSSQPHSESADYQLESMGKEAPHAESADYQLESMGKEAPHSESADYQHAIRIEVSK